MTLSFGPLVVTTRRRVEDLEMRVIGAEHALRLAHDAAAVARQQVHMLRTQVSEIRDGVRRGIGEQIAAEAWAWMEGPR